MVQIGFYLSTAQDRYSANYSEREARSFMCLNMIEDRVYPFENVKTFSHFRKNRAPVHGFHQISGIWQASPSPASLGFPLSVPAACGRDEIYNLK